LKQTYLGKYVFILYFTLLIQLSPPDAISLILLEEDEEEPLNAVEWIHLQCVYEILLRFILSPNVEPKKAGVGIVLEGVNNGEKIDIISSSFVVSLMYMFDSEDPRERDYLKSTLHRLLLPCSFFSCLFRRYICTLFNTPSFNPYHHGPHF
jgi:serine/threonine-protein phosphatase 2A regulatory subunit B'